MKPVKVALEQFCRAMESATKIPAAQALFPSSWRGPLAPSWGALVRSALVQSCTR